MVPSPRVSTLLEDPGWRYPIAVGLASVPYTLYAGWPSLSDISPPVAVVGFVAAFLYFERGEVDTFHVGGRAGLVALVPITWWLVEVVRFTAVTDTPLRFGVPGVMLVVLLAFPTFAASSYVVGGLAGRVGGWLAARTTTRRPAIPAP